MIFVIYHDEARKEGGFSVKEDPYGIVYITISKYSDMLGNYRENLKSYIVKKYLAYIGDTR